MPCDKCVSVFKRPTRGLAEVHYGYAAGFDYCKECNEVDPDTVELELLNKKAMMKEVIKQLQGIGYSTKKLEKFWR